MVMRNLGMPLRLFDHRELYLQPGYCSYSWFRSRRCVLSVEFELVPLNSE